MDATAGTTGLERPQEFEFTMTRFFAAPRETIFRIMIDPLLIPRWWGPARARTVVDNMDVRPGGEWRFVQYDDQGEEYAFHGSFQEVEFPARLSYSLEREGTAGEDRTETLTLADTEGRTQVTVSASFETHRARRAAMDAGIMEDFAAGMDRFAALLGETDDTPLEHEQAPPVGREEPSI
jgi:uncharacterized protein YndB with AHSA1/START domain